MTPRFWSSGFRKEAREVCYSIIQHRWGAKENIFRSAAFQCRMFFSHHFMSPTQSVSVLTPVLLGNLIRNRGSIMIWMQTDVSVIIPKAWVIRVFANVAEMWRLFSWYTKVSGRLPFTWIRVGVTWSTLSPDYRLTCSSQNTWAQASLYRRPAL